MMGYETVQQAETTVGGLYMYHVLHNFALNLKTCKQILMFVL